MPVLLLLLVVLLLLLLTQPVLVVVVAAVAMVVVPLDDCAGALSSLTLTLQPGGLRGEMGRELTSEGASEARVCRWSHGAVRRCTNSVTASVGGVTSSRM